MKCPLFCAFLLSLFLVSESVLHEHHQKIIRKVQRHFALQSRLRRPGATWEAGENSLTDKDPRDLRHLCGAIIPNRMDARRSYHSSPPLLEATKRVTIPDQFDAAKMWPTCSTIKQVRDQCRYCGSCWAFAGAGVISDRFCIASMGIRTKIFSPQDMLLCAGQGRPENICAGGSLEKPYMMLIHSGAVSGGDYMSRDGCMPTLRITAVLLGMTNAPEYALIPIVACSMHKIRPMDRLGPLTVGIPVFDDFVTYKSGVYQYVTGNPVYGHAMKLIGWGSENGTDYWLIVNSWGREWGLDGMVKIVRGINHLEIENYLVTAMVDPGLKRPIGIGKAG